MEKIINIAGLRKQLGSNFTLQIEHLALQPQQVAWLKGSNGSGKSTLLKILSGLLPADTCHRFTVLGSGKPCPPQVVYLHQSSPLLRRSVFDNIRYGVSCCGLPSQNISEAIEWAGLEALAERMPHQLSGGEKRRVALARVWALKPQLYLLDEPLAYLDESGQAQIKALALSLLADGKQSAVISSHEEITFANQTWHLENGTIS